VPASALGDGAVSVPFADLPRGHFGAIYADPPWRFATWNKATAIKRRASGTNVCAAVHYNTMSTEDILALPVADVGDRLTAVLFLWISWPMLTDAHRV
jgi:N6-adenosine-specific RNA methylase IME4